MHSRDETERIEKAFQDMQVSSGETSLGPNHAQQVEEDEVPLEIFVEEMPFLIEAARAYASIGEMREACTL